MKRSVFVIVLFAAICLFTEHLVMPSPQIKTAATPASPGEETATPRQTSELLLVNANHPLPDDYRPEKLVELKSKQFQLMSADIEICETVFMAMERMFSAAQADGVHGFIITSGYRTYAEQAEIFKTSPSGTAALPGCSEHEAGLAFDVGSAAGGNFGSTPQFDWLSEHCAEYGFILRYPPGKESITGISYEPWHYRYVGVPAATEIMENGLTLEEYLGADAARFEFEFEENHPRRDNMRPGRMRPQ